MTILGDWFAELMRRNADVRLFGPDEVLSNRLGAVFDVTDRAWAEALHPLDEHLARSGRVIEALSEHLMQGMLEGYLLTGRHGLITSYEAFIHIVDSMFNQHAKWLESAAGCRGAATSPRSTTCSRRTCGGRTTTASRIRTPASSTSW